MTEKARYEKVAVKLAKTEQYALARREGLEKVFDYVAAFNGITEAYMYRLMREVGEEILAQISRAEALNPTTLEDGE